MHFTSALDDEKANWAPAFKKVNNSLLIQNVILHLHQSDVFLDLFPRPFVNPGQYMSARKQKTYGLLYV